ncbi:DUF4269 domain-containing protein [Paenibacillus sp. SC116]|uniref:DUF4269 domain-containing protein n=1 Tax=Paenibacillus sp. SC116 TaxID=2968986 RepID=UPI00215ADD9E|nr:DUF4269 domain-containing protein [Paenibacillus sp. SC116]MCR8845874.1 DUF4269 domain-containing protein [Paenibacillus sp. SC116]
MFDLNKHDFTNLSYLQYGNGTQQRAYSILHSLNIMELLHSFNPILVGTIPIDIHVSSSDLDIICEVYDVEAFMQFTTSLFQNMDQYHYAVHTDSEQPYTVVNFQYENWELEIFAQPIPTKRQNGYRHMIVEHRILQLLGSDGYRAIRELKENGYKTEPAFAKLLQLEGDPYKRLLELEEWDEEQLSQFVMQSRSSN